MLTVSCLHSFLILFVLFVLALEFSERARINVFEGIFMVYALGFALEKVAAMQEHGIKGTSTYYPRITVFLRYFSLFQGHVGTGHSQFVEPISDPILDYPLEWLRSCLRYA